MKNKKYRINDEEIPKIIELYKNGMTLDSISIQYNCSRTAIKNAINRLNPNLISRHRKFSINDNFFDIIDTEEKAYILGFLYADGYNNLDKNYFRIVLQRRDRELLEKIKTELNTDKNIRDLVRKSKFPSKNYNKIYEASELTINNKNLCNALVKLGVYQNKSLSLKFPTIKQVPENLIRHFIRGYFDGDGSLVLTYRNNKIIGNISICTAVDFANELSYYIENKININTNIYSIKGYKEQTKTFSIGGNIQVLKFLSYIYDNSKIFLNRKKNKYTMYKIKYKRDYIQ